ncbi:MAG TPA: hypothetical protein VHY20_07645, partial [Pirellulales bacterium]|nr:hypothetical protein [Pirellulales bacterium]
MQERFTLDDFRRLILQTEPRIWLLVLVFCGFIADAAPLRGEPTAAVDVEILRRKQEYQQRARDLARELVSSILDIQLQQLSENGLEHLPL